MTELIIFWTLTLIIAAALAVLRDVLSDDPTGDRDYQPPRSHHDDPFSRSGSSWTRR